MNIIIANSGSCAEWISAIGTWFGAVASIIVAIVAIFTRRIEAAFWHPKLQVESSNTDHILSEDSGRFIRLRIANTGNDVARNVEVHLLAVTSNMDRPPAIPIRLTWTHEGSNSATDASSRQPTTKPFIPPQCSAYLDFGEYVRVNNVNYLRLKTEVTKPDNYWSYSAGEYIFKIGVYCAENRHTIINRKVKVGGDGSICIEAGIN